MCIKYDREGTNCEKNIYLLPIVAAREALNQRNSSQKV